MASITDADKVLRNDTGKSIVSKLDDIKDAIVAQGGGAHTLDQLSDVDIDDQTLANGQSIVYNSTTQKFENNTVSTVGELNDLTDVRITSAQQGDSLRNDGNGNWINEPTTIVMEQDDWDDIQDKTAWKNAHKNTNLIISDAPNLNATAQNLSYDGGVTSTWDEVESKQDKIKIKSFTATSDASGNIEIPDLTVTDNVIISCMSSNGYATNAVPSGNKFYFKILTNNNPITPMGNQTTDCYIMYY